MHNNLQIRFNITMQTNTTFKTTERTKNTEICMGLDKLLKTDLDNILDNITS